MHVCILNLRFRNKTRKTLMKKLIALLALTFFSQAYSYDLAHKFGIGISGGIPIPIGGNNFNDVADAKWAASIYGRYLLTSSFGLDLGVSKEKFKNTDLNFENINLMAFCRTAGAADLSPVFGVGTGLTRIKNYVSPSSKLSLYARAGLEYGLSHALSLAGLVDYQYVSKIMGDMPTGRDHVLIPQLALTFYFGGEKEKEKEKTAEPEKEKVTYVEEGVSVKEAAPMREVIPQVTVEFDFNKADIKPSFNDQLQAVADYMNTNEDSFGLIEGHTDNIGPKAVNDRLSIKRAEVVKERLMKLGVDQKRLKAQGFGYANPIASNSSREGRQKNRRSTVVISIVQKLSNVD